MGLSWVATEAKTGIIIADLPDLDVKSVKSVIGRYDTTPATLPLPTAPENWLRATQAGATHLHLLADNPNDPAHGIPLWGARVTTRERTEGDVVQMTLATLESYTDVRYVGDYAPVGVGQNSIISAIFAAYVIAGTPNGGVPFRVVTSGTNTARDRTYQNQNNTTVYSSLQDLMGVIGGPEWTVGWEWQTSPERITPVLYVSSRIGTASTSPAAVFEMPGPVKTFKYMENFANGKGANLVIASSSGTTTARPQSAPQSVVDGARPTIEYRWTPSTSISDVATLNSYALAAVTAMDGGTNSVEMSAVMAEAPQLGTDWFIGDDLGYSIGVTGVVPAFPAGFAGVARAIGFQVDISDIPVITPILAGSNV